MPYQGEWNVVSLTQIPNPINIPTTPSNNNQLKNIIPKMKHTLPLLALLALLSTSLADKQCTPSFDYCAEKLVDSQGEYS